MKKLSFVLVVVLLAGCASDTSALMRESAISIGGNLHSDSVQVQNIDRGFSIVRWDAVTAQGLYNCNADYHLTEVHCVLYNSPAANVSPTDTR
jgi:hypothetical protein